MWRNTITGDQVEADEESCSLAADKRQPVIVIIQRSLFCGQKAAYFCAGFTGGGVAGVAGCVFTGCDFIPSSTDFGPLCPAA